MSGQTNKYVFDFLREMSPSLVGLKRSNKLKHTFVAAPYLSSCVALDVFNDQLHLGIPRGLFDSLYKLRLYSLSYIPKQTCFFFVFDVDTYHETLTHPIAIRFYMREKLVDQFDYFQKIHIVSMEDDGTFSKRKGKHIPLPLRCIKELEWEKY